MQEKMCLSLRGHESLSNRQRLNKMIDEAQGDVEAFTRAYRERFLCAAGLLPESEAKEAFKQEGYFIVN